MPTTHFAAKCCLFSLLLIIGNFLYSITIGNAAFPADDGINVFFPIDGNNSWPKAAVVKRQILQQPLPQQPLPQQPLPQQPLPQLPPVQPLPPLPPAMLPAYPYGQLGQLESFGYLQQLEKLSTCFDVGNGQFRCVFISTQPMSWNGARQFCQTILGATLFSIKAQPELPIISSIVGVFRRGLTTQAKQRSFWLGMQCQCRIGDPFSCYQCSWTDGHPVGAYSMPPTSRNDPRIGVVWSREYANDHFWRALDGQMCMFITEHLALYDCGYIDPFSGFMCDVTNRQAQIMAVANAAMGG